MEHMKLLQTLTLSGGEWVIYLLIASSVVAVAVMIERAVVIFRNRTPPDLMGPEAFAKLRNRDIAGALGFVRGHTLASRLAAELQSHAAEGLPGLEKVLERHMLLGRRRLERRLLVLGTLGNNAPFVGLLGTVLGVIRAFHDLALAAGAGPEVVMQGLSEALVATAVGIAVAIPCVVAYNYFRRAVKETMADLDHFGRRLIELLEPGAAALEKPARKEA